VTLTEAPVPDQPQSDELPDMCNPADYEGFDRQDLKDLWAACCKEAHDSGIFDPDCHRPQWR